ncbi:MAG: translation elongation factor Ts [Kofleriaceae bacterium]|nr:translation elongation factor Ts [Kofleriaceae bacterium]MCB9571637.1 translation elongation factor Ts [Kofleriaceae bacterium]
MADVTASMIKDLRERTGAGMSDCKKALVETDADMEKAIDFLRKKGLAKAAKKAGREATEGAVVSYIHGGGRIGVMVEVNCETDFVARNEDFQAFCREVALQIAAMNPLYVRTEEVPADAVAREKEIRLEQARQSGKPEQVIQKMLEGQLSKWMKEICLLDQPWVKDDKKSIADLQQDLIAKIGENIRVRRFARFELGEGLDKKQGDDFAAEVAKTAGLA